MLRSAEHLIDRRPVGLIDHDMVVVLLGLLHGRPAGDDADREHADGAAERHGLGLRAATFCAVSSTEVRDDCMKNASQLRTAKARPSGDAPAFMISGPRAAVRLGLRAHALQLDELRRRNRNRRAPTTSA